MNLKDIYKLAEESRGLCIEIPFMKEPTTVCVYGNTEMEWGKIRVLHPHADWEEFLKNWEEYKSSDERLRRKGLVEAAKQKYYDWYNLPFYKRWFTKQPRYWDM